MNVLSRYRGKIGSGDWDKYNNMTENIRGGQRKLGGAKKIWKIVISDTSERRMGYQNAPQVYGVSEIILRKRIKLIEK